MDPSNKATNEVAKESRITDWLSYSVELKKIEQIAAMGQSPNLSSFCSIDHAVLV